MTISKYCFCALILLCISIVAVPMTGNAESSTTWRFPAEFEKQESVWLGWLSKSYIKGYDTDSVFVQIVKELVPNVKVRICVPDAKHKDHVQKVLAKHGIHSKNITFFTIPFTMPYWRDFGPIFTVDEDGNKSIADFNFNCWGYFSDTAIHSRMLEKIDRSVAKHLGLSSRMTRVVSEGGDREFNGKGTILLTEACEFQRNPNVSRHEIQAELTKTLGVSNFIWLKRGTVDDDANNTSTLPGPGGKGFAYRSGSANNHIDEYCRFVGPNTILLAEVSKEEASRGPVEKENRRRMEENFTILKNSLDQDGKPFKIIRIPMPETLFYEASPNDDLYMGLASYAAYKDGTVFPVGQSITVVPALSYCNFLISNGIVLAQKYWEDGMPQSVREKDETALNVLKKAFPEYKIIAINTLGLNFGGGGIHCSTQQEPFTGK